METNHKDCQYCFTVMDIGIGAIADCGLPVPSDTVILFAELLDSKDDGNGTIMLIMPHAMAEKLSAKLDQQLYDILVAEPIESDPDDTIA